VVHLGFVTIMQLMGVPFSLPPAGQAPIPMQVLIMNGFLVGIQ